MIGVILKIVLICALILFVVTLAGLQVLAAWHGKFELPESDDMQSALVHAWIRESIIARRLLFVGKRESE